MKNINFSKRKKKEKVLISFFTEKRIIELFYVQSLRIAFMLYVNLKKFKLYLYRKLINEITSKNKKKK